MKWFSLNRKLQQVSTDVRLAYCERTTASPSSPRHIRVVQPGESLKTTGGLRATTLCGSELQGWDLYTDTVHEIAATVAYYGAHPEHEVGRVCSECAAVAVKDFED